MNTFLWPRILLALFALLCLAPTFIHYRFVDYRLEGTRYPWGLLLPAHFLFLRCLADFSVWLCIGLVVAVGWSFRRPASTPRLLTFGATAAILFLTAYTCYALVIVAFLLANRSI